MTVWAEIWGLDFQEGRIGSLVGEEGSFRDELKDEVWC